MNLAPLAVYIHWPYCARICPYCDFNVVRDRGRKAQQEALVAAIKADLAAQARQVGPRRLTSVFFGGGTPSLMEPAWTAEILEVARSQFEAADSLEVTLEANPTDAEASLFAGFAAAGVDRLSLGVQSFDDQELAFLGRNHDAASAQRALQAAIAAFPRVSIDMIYALPGQTPRAWAEALRRAAVSGVEHISPYQLTIETGTAFGRKVDRGAFSPPAPDLAAALYETTQAVLENAGFQAYEVSNHASGEAARSMHNLAVWRGWEYVGAGPGAHGRLTLGGVRTATLAEPLIEDYLRAVAETGTGFASTEALDAREAAIERLLMGLRTEEGVEIAQIAALDLAALPELVDQGFLVAGPDRLVATAKGRPVLDRLVLQLTG